MRERAFFIMLIKTNSRKDVVRRQKQIIDHVSRRSEVEHGSSENMKGCFHDLQDVARKGGLIKENKSEFSR